MEKKNQPWTKKQKKNQKKNINHRLWASNDDLGVYDYRRKVFYDVSMIEREDEMEERDELRD
jgi:hypothetical protein